MRLFNTKKIEFIVKNYLIYQKLQLNRANRYLEKILKEKLGYK